MSALDDVLAQFTVELGMGSDPIDTDAPVVFRFERSGRLFVERRGERILVYLEAPAPAQGHQTLVAALAACDIGQRRAMPVRAGLTTDDRLVFGVVLQDRDFTLQALHAALTLLIRLHAEVTA